MKSLHHQIPKCTWACPTPCNLTGGKHSSVHVLFHQFPPKSEPTTHTRKINPQDMTQNRIHCKYTGEPPNEGMLVQPLPFAERSREYFWIDIHLGWGPYDRQHTTSVYVCLFILVGVPTMESMLPAYMLASLQEVLQSVSSLKLHRKNKNCTMVVNPGARTLCRQLEEN